jgi:hypothetical protein
MAFLEEKIDNFFSLLQRTSRSKRQQGSTPEAATGRRVQAPVATTPAPDAIEAAKRALNEVSEPLQRAVSGQDKRRNQLEAERLAGLWIRAQRGGDYAYRVLKDGFDRHCEDAGLDPVSDHMFPRWLQAHGGQRYRCNYPKVTMYKLPRRRAPARSAAFSEVGVRC